MLEVGNVSKFYPRPEGVVRVLEDISLSVSPGEFVSVHGPSGCGKTTLLLAIGGLLRPDRGRVLIGNTDIYALSANQRARFRAASIGFVFQQFHLVPYLDVFNNVLAASLAIEAREPEKRAAELIEQFGLKPRAGHVPAELSTGERQRAALARALLNRPQLLLADEPTGNLDQENADLVLTHLSEFAQRGGAVILVTHSHNAAHYADRIVHLSEGKID